MQLEELREQIVHLKSNLADDAKHTKEELKFELMHEKSPQVANLKDFLAQQARALTTPLWLKMCFMPSLLPLGAYLPLHVTSKDVLSHSVRSSSV